MITVPREYWRQIKGGKWCGKCTVGRYGCSEGLDVGSQERLLHSKVCSVYLITYSQANLDTFQTRDSFAKMVVQTFNETRSGLADIVRWVCSQEQHSSEGMHYHMAVKLSHLHQRFCVRNYLDDNHSIQVNFSTVHSNYYCPCRSTTEEDRKYVQSVNQLELVNSVPPGTQEASLTTADCSATKRKANKTEGTLSQYLLYIFLVSVFSSQE